MLQDLIRIVRYIKLENLIPHVVIVAIFQLELSPRILFPAPQHRRSHQG